LTTLQLHRQELEAFRDDLHAKYGIKDLGQLKRFLYYQITRDRSAKLITLHQHDFIAELLSLENMSNCAPATSPGDLVSSLSSAQGASTAEELKEMSLIPYRQITGGIST
jgi:hypothetical protein